MPTASFRERLYPSLGANLALGLSGPMVFLAALPINQLLSWVLGISVPIALIAVANLVAPVIELDERQLKVGKMRLPLSALGKISVYKGEEARHERGPGLNPATQRLFRGDIDAVVRVEVMDPHDPTDFVLFSSRRGEELAVALGAD